MGLERLREELQRTGIPVEHLAPEKKRVYLVGGCIRDALLGRHIVDFDFVVEDSGINYAEDLARKVGGRFVPLKLDEGRVVYKRSLVLDFSGLGTRKIEDDLRDRDFTINAMAVELQDLLHARWRILDPCSGMEDLSSKVIRTVAEDSLVKDPVRLLRAFRFASELDFVIEGNTMNALKLHRDLIRGVAGERISYELKLILQSDASWKQVDEMGEVSLLVTLFPELREMDTLLPEIELLTHSIASLRELEGLLSGTRESIDRLKPWSASYFHWKHRKPLLKLATLLHDIGKPNTLSSDKKGRVHFYGHDMLGEKLLHPILKERLRLSNAEVEAITRLVRYHMRPHLLGREEELTPRAMRRFPRGRVGRGSAPRIRRRTCERKWRCIESGITYYATG